MRQLPPRPNLEFLRTSAKALLARLRSGDAEAARTLIAHLPGAAGLTEAEVFSHRFRLADAQGAVARISGFETWPALARHVDCLRSMEGKWAFKSLEVDGLPVPAAMLGASFMLIDGDRFRMESPEGVYEGVFLIDVEASPNHIDIDFNEGPEAGNRCTGIFELNGDSFTLCLGLVGSSRPAHFGTSPGSGHALETLTRVENARPSGVDGGTPPPPRPSHAPASADDVAGFDRGETSLLRSLQGEWIPIEIVNAGKRMDPSFTAYGSRVNSGAETRVVFGGQTMLHAKVRINDATAPIEVDYLHLSGPHTGALSRGVFRWEGEDAVFSLAPPGQPRPSSFSSELGSDVMMSRWRRKM
jgi:uncharacterized protein (TIGR03067 family)